MTNIYDSYMDRIADTIKKWLGEGWSKGMDSYDAFLLIKKIVDEESD